MTELKFDMPESKRRLELAQQALDYALRFVGLPYMWGGDDAVEGFDCSGLAIEMLKSVGIVEPNFDTTAHYLSKMYPKVDRPDAGVLAFYGKEIRITHVGICLGRSRLLEAGGGNSRVTDRDSVAANDAFIRIRPIDYRKDRVCFCDPFQTGG